MPNGRIKCEHEVESAIASRKAVDTLDIFIEDLVIIGLAVKAEGERIKLYSNAVSNSKCVKGTSPQSRIDHVARRMKAQTCKWLLQQSDAA